MVVVEDELGRCMEGGSDNWGGLRAWWDVEEEEESNVRLGRCLFDGGGLMVSCCGN